MNSTRMQTRSPIQILLIFEGKCSPLEPLVWRWRLKGLVPTTNIIFSLDLFDQENMIGRGLTVVHCIDSKYHQTKRWGLVDLVYFPKCRLVIFWVKTLHLTKPLDVIYCNINEYWKFFLYSFSGLIKGRNCWKSFNPLSA